MLEVMDFGCQPAMPVDVRQPEPIPSYVSLDISFYRNRPGQGLWLQPDSQEASFSSVDGISKPAVVLQQKPLSVWQRIAALSADVSPMAVCSDDHTPRICDDSDLFWKCTREEPHERRDREMAVERAMELELAQDDFGFSDPPVIPQTFTRDADDGYNDDVDDAEDEEDDGDAGAPEFLQLPVKPFLGTDMGIPIAASSSCSSIAIAEKQIRPEVNFTENFGTVNTDVGNNYDPYLQTIKPGFQEKQACHIPWPYRSSSFEQYDAIVARIHGHQRWEDTEFPRFQRPGIHWKRAKDIWTSYCFEMPHVGQAEYSSDMCRGYENDGWLLGAIANIATSPHLIEQVFGKHDMAHSVFEFRFFKDGKWVHLCVDDFLPVLENGALLYGQSDEEGELWVPLLHKAYAKLHGGYDQLCHAVAHHEYALHTLSQGIPHILAFPDPWPDNSYQQDARLVLTKVRHALAERWPISVTWRPAGQLLNGLLPHHLYSIIGLHECRESNGSCLYLMQIANPWGLKGLWHGPWSYSSALWDAHPEAERSLGKLVRGFNAALDGSFWMDVDSFFLHAEQIIILQCCHWNFGQRPFHYVTLPAQSDLRCCVQAPYSTVARLALTAYGVQHREASWKLGLTVFDATSTGPDVSQWTVVDMVDNSVPVVAGSPEAFQTPMIATELQLLPEHQYIIYGICQGLGDAGASLEIYSSEAVYLIPLDGPHVPQQCRTLQPKHLQQTISEEDLQIQQACRLLVCDWSTVWKSYQFPALRSATLRKPPPSQPGEPHNRRRLHAQRPPGSSPTESADRSSPGPSASSVSSDDGCTPGRPIEEMSDTAVSLVDLIAAVEHSSKKFAELAHPKMGSNKPCPGQSATCAESYIPRPWCPTPVEAGPSPPVSTSGHQMFSASRTVPTVIYKKDKPLKPDSAAGETNFSLPSPSSVTSISPTVLANDFVSYDPPSCAELVDAKQCDPKKSYPMGHPAAFAQDLPLVYRSEQLTAKVPAQPSHRIAIASDPSCPAHPASQDPAPPAKADHIPRSKADGARTSTQLNSIPTSVRPPANKADSIPTLMSVQDLPCISPAVQPSSSTWGHSQGPPKIVAHQAEQLSVNQPNDQTAHQVGLLTDPEWASWLTTLTPAERSMFASIMKEPLVKPSTQKAPQPTLSNSTMPVPPPIPECFPKTTAKAKQVTYQTKVPVPPAVSKHRNTIPLAPRERDVSRGRSASHTPFDQSSPRFMQPTSSSVQKLRSSTPNRPLSPARMPSPTPLGTIASLQSRRPSPRLSSRSPTPTRYRSPGRISPMLTVHDAEQHYASVARSTSFVPAAALTKSALSGNERLAAAQCSSPVARRTTGSTPFSYNTKSQPMGHTIVRSGLTSESGSKRSCSPALRGQSPARHGRSNSPGLMLSRASSRERSGATMSCESRRQQSADRRPGRPKMHSQNTYVGPLF